MSSVVELRKNIVDKVIDLGVNLDFLENPAFIVALSEINALIGEINIEDPGVVLVDRSNGTLSFDYTASNGDRFKFDLACLNSSTIRCIRADEPHSFVGNDGKVVRKKSVVEYVAELGERGEVTIFVNNGAIDNIYCDNHHYNINSSVERRIYTTRGVMYERESKTYATRKGEGYFHRVGVNEMLLLSRQAFDYAPWSDSYAKRTLLRREMLDTAKLFYENRLSDNNYCGVVPLNSVRGLRDMIIAKEYNKFPVNEVEINPLTKAEIADLLARESDERVAEGLSYFAKGRENYCYSSN